VQLQLRGTVRASGDGRARQCRGAAERATETSGGREVSRATRRAGCRRLGSARTDGGGSGSGTLGGEERVDFNLGGGGGGEAAGREGKGPEVVASFDENQLLSETGAVNDRDERSDR